MDTSLPSSSSRTTPQRRSRLPTPPAMKTVDRRPPICLLGRMSDFLQTPWFIAELLALLNKQLSNDTMSELSNEMGAVLAEMERDPTAFTKASHAAYEWVRDTALLVAGLTPDWRSRLRAYNGYGSAANVPARLEAWDNGELPPTHFRRKINRTASGDLSNNAQRVRWDLKHVGEQGA